LARPTEAAAIAHLSRDLVEQGLRWRWTPARVAGSILSPNVNVLVACIHGNIAGFAIMRYGDDAANLDLLGVAPAHRRAGIGRRLLQWLEKCAVVAGIFKVTLEVREGNDGARLFYERMGYSTLSHLPGYYQGIESALRMGRNLSSRSPDHAIRETQKIFEEIFGILPRYLADLSTNRSSLLERE
jgi:ribosomal-protein-alanine N-acetyltransferase